MVVPSGDTIALFVIAVVNALTAYASWRTHQNMKTLEVNTNSIKDALVKTTRESAQATGEAKGRADQKAENSARS